jgi:hypothetical protein
MCSHRAMLWLPSSWEGTTAMLIRNGRFQAVALVVAMIAATACTPDLESSGTSISRSAVTLLAGTNPSIATLSSNTSPPSGFVGYASAFQGSDGKLYISDSKGALTATGLAMKSGTSPAITATSGGAYQVAYHASDETLHLYTSAGTDWPTGQLMKSTATSPSITTLTTGFCEVAFQNSNTNLAFFNTGTWSGFATGMGMNTATSPSITWLSSGGFEAAMQSNVGQLWLYNSTSGGVNTNDGMNSGSSPSITTLSTGNYEVAYEVNTNHLYVRNQAGSDTDTGQVMQGGTSPSIAAMPSGEFKVAFHFWLWDNLCWYKSDGTSANTSQGMSSGSSPSIAAWSTSAQAGGYEIAFKTNSSLPYLYTDYGGLNGSSATLTGTNTKYWYVPDGQGNTKTATNQALPGSETWHIDAPDGSHYLQPGDGGVPHLHHDNETPTDDGDQFHYYEQQDGGTPIPAIDTPYSADLSGNTGYLAPSPTANFQMRNSVQWGTGAGQVELEVQMSNETASLVPRISTGAYMYGHGEWRGMHHNVAMGRTPGSDSVLRPWSTTLFGTTPGPVLNVSAYEQVQKLTASNGEDGYLCVFIVDTGNSPTQGLEYCVVKWRNNQQRCDGVAYKEGVNCFTDNQITDPVYGHPAETVSSEAPPCNFIVYSVIGPGTQLVTPLPGTITTLSKTGDGVRGFYGYQISRANLLQAIAWVNQSLGPNGFNMLNTSCNGAQTWKSYSNDPNYYTISFQTFGGIENGAEGYATEVGWNTDSLQMWTSY